MAQRKISKIAMIPITLACLALMLTAYAAVTVSTTINTTGTMVYAIPSNIGVYSDSACTVALAPIDWGSLSPGGTLSKTFYVKNIAGVASLTLSMATSNWSPTTANGPITLTWNRQGTVLAPGQSTMATITLSTSASMTGITSFGVQIIISGTG
jgi:hypothetical protein